MYHIIFQSIFVLVFCFYLVFRHIIGDEQVIVIFPEERKKERRRKIKRRRKPGPIDEKAEGEKLSAMQEGIAIEVDT